jgi:hypothetical protein
MMKGLAVFVLLAVALDLGIGSAMGHLYRRTYTGERGGLTNYGLSKDADVLILGSSRAQYQIMPSVLRDKLSMSAFNAGLKGHDFLYSVMFFDLWRRSHPMPRAIVLQVDIESLLDRPGELESAQLFSPYLDQSALVREVLYSADRFKRFEYWSRAYRYNGKAFSIARNLFSRPDVQFDGFLQANGQLDPETAVRANALDQDATAIEQANRPYSERKLRYLRELASLAARERTGLFLVHTPLFDQDRAAHQRWASRLSTVIADLADVEFVDICEATHPEIFAHTPELYSDTNHLNARGAVILSTLLADRLKARLGRLVDLGLHGRATTSKAQSLN